MLPLLEEIRITFIEPCLAEAAKIRFKAEFSTDISPVLPYLNSILRNATYNHRAPTLTFTREFRLLTLYPRHLTVAKALNTTDAWQVVDWLKDLINETWA